MGALVPHGKVGRGVISHHLPPRRAARARAGHAWGEAAPPSPPASRRAEARACRSTRKHARAYCHHAFAVGFVFIETGLVASCCSAAFFARVEAPAALRSSHRAVLSGRPDG